MKVKLYTTPTCGPCRQLKAKIAADAVLAPQVEIVDITTSTGMEEARKYSIFSVPVMLFFKDGQPVNQLSGPVSTQAIKDVLEHG